MRLRRADPQDADATADVLIRSRRAAAGAIPPAVHPETEIREWVRTTVIPDREVWLAENDQILGVLVLEHDWIDQLYVAPGFTGTGVGSRLLDLAKSRRPEGLQLWTFAANVRAQRFYHHHGFTEAERTDGSGNEERSPDIRFTWTPPHP